MKEIRYVAAMIRIKETGKYVICCHKPTGKLTLPFLLIRQGDTPLEQQMVNDFGCEIMSRRLIGVHGHQRPDGTNINVTYFYITIEGNLKRMNSEKYSSVEYADIEFFPTKIDFSNYPKTIQGFVTEKTMEKFRNV